MSTYAGEFVLVHGATGEPSSGLVGRGTVELSAAGVVLTTTRQRGGLAKLVATLVAIVVTLVFVVVLVTVLDTFHVEVEDIRLPGVAGVVVAALTWFGVERLLIRFLPVAPVRHALTWSFVTAVRPGRGRVDVVTTSPDLHGLSGFVIDRPDVFAAECASLRRGAG